MRRALHEVVGGGAGRNSVRGNSRSRAISLPFRCRYAVTASQALRTAESRDATGRPRAAQRLAPAQCTIPASAGLSRRELAGLASGLNLVGACGVRREGAAPCLERPLPNGVRPWV